MISNQLQMEERPYFRNLDALRLLTFVVVFFRHGFFTNNPDIAESAVFKSLPRLFSFAYTGLDFFSVLSSFLITWLILREYSSTGGFRMGNFYMRRILRIWPLYFLMLLIGYAIIPLAAAALHYPVPGLPPIGWFLCFAENYYTAYVREDFLFFLVFLWFISIEEQFYLVWGLTMKYLHRYLLPVCGLFIGVYLAFKYIWYKIPFPSFYDTVNYLPDFAIGAALAWAVIRRHRVIVFLDSIRPWQWLVFYISSILIIVFQQYVFMNIDVDNFKHIILALIFAMMIYDQCFNTRRIFNAGKYSFLNYLGRLNFGLYCWHGVVITLLKKSLELSGHTDTASEVFLIYPFVALILSIVLAALSYEFFEKRFLKLKQYFSPRF